MNVDGCPFKFVTLFVDVDYYCFLKSEDTIKELIIEWFKIILGNKCHSSKDYDANLIFQGVTQRPERCILTLFSKKEDNSIMFLLRKHLEKDFIIPYKNMVCSKTKTKKPMAILNIVANLL